MIPSSVSTVPDSPTPPEWRPRASIENLRRRAELLRRTREFFAARDVLEVETPLIGAATVTDPHLHPLRTELEIGGQRRAGYLQTSPEFAMKRLLAAGSGSIFQLCKAFRDRESGSRHNPEFTLLEWYRVGWDHHRLMDEVDELLGALLASPAAERITYRDLFQRHLGLDPVVCPLSELEARVGDRLHGGGDRDQLLAFLFTHDLEPRLDGRRPTFVYHYPESQCALARLGRDPDGQTIAERFEVYLGGVELANGFHELCDPVEQRRRFEREAAERLAVGHSPAVIDQKLVAALEAGLPDCAGVALGFDRLVLLALGLDRIEEVLAFPIDRA